MFLNIYLLLTKHFLSDMGLVQWFFWHTLLETQKLRSLRSQLQEGQRNPSGHSLCTRHFLLSLHVLEFKPHRIMALEESGRRKLPKSTKLQSQGHFSDHSVLLLTIICHLHINMVNSLPWLYLHFFRKLRLGKIHRVATLSKLGS